MRRSRRPCASRTKPPLVARVSCCSPKPSSPPIRVSCRSAPSSAAAPRPGARRISATGTRLSMSPEPRPRRSAQRHDGTTYTSRIGVIERARRERGATLYCTLLYFGPDGALLGTHRKLKPTAAERVIWGEGDGSTLSAFRTELGTIGGLICWENYMPLARMAMYGKGVEIYLAPTADSRDAWQATLRHIACEGRCFVLGANQFVTRSMWPVDWEPLPDGPEILCRGGSVIIGPLGDVLAGPLYDTEGILTADLERDELTRARFDFDVVGHYSRPDVDRKS